MPLGLALLAAVVNQGAAGSGDANSAAGGGTAPNGTPVPNAPPVQADPTQPDPVAAASATAPLQGDLAFAVKLNPQEPAQAPAEKTDGGDSATPPQGASTLPQGTIAGRIAMPAKAMAAVTPVKEVHRAELEPDAPQPAPRAEMLAQAVPAIQTAAKDAPSGPPPVAPPPTDAGAKALDATPIQPHAVDASAKAAGPMKDLSIQVGQTQNDRVEVRMVDRGGELQVAVRAANPDVAQGLRQGLSDLSDRLEQNGFHAETWRPGTSVTAVQGTGETQQKSTQFQRDGSQSQSGGSQQGRQQNSQQQPPRPRWVQELEGRMTGGSTSFTGESHGLTS